MPRLPRLIERLWPIDGAQRSGPLANYYRANVLALFFLSCLIGLGPFIIIAAVIMHSRALGAVVLAFLALNMLSNAAAECFRLGYVMNVGHWTRKDGSQVRRSTEPRQFWARFAQPAAGIGITLAGGVFIALLALWAVGTIQVP